MLVYVKKAMSNGERVIQHWIALTPEIGWHGTHRKGDFEIFE
jgi:hypothetical protein